VGDRESKLSGSPNQPPPKFLRELYLLLVALGEVIQRDLVDAVTRSLTFAVNLSETAKAFATCLRAV
jgi:hypothetical protein